MTLQFAMVLFSNGSHRRGFMQGRSDCFFPRPAIVFLSLVLWFGIACGSKREAKVEPARLSATTPVPRSVSTDSTQTRDTDQTVIVKLSDEFITYGHLRPHMDPRKAIALSRMAGREDLKPFLVKQLEEKTIDPLIEQWLLLQEAKRLGLEVTPEEIDNLLLQTKSHFTEEQFKTWMASLGDKKSSLERLFANKILIAKMQRSRDRKYFY